ncbi:MAG: hypothetical protein ACOCQ4_01145 [bacterium]
MKNYPKIIHEEIFTLNYPGFQTLMIMVYNSKDEIIETIIAHPDQWYILIGDENDNLPVCLN